MESNVLLRVEDFEKSGRRVSVNGTERKLVYLVENEYRVRTACPLHSLNDTAGHSSDIGATMTTNLTLIMHTAQADAHIFAAKRFGYAFAKTCLTDSWRAIQTDDGTLTVLAHLQHSQMLQDAFLDLLHPIVVTIQLLFGHRNIGVVTGTFVPRQSYNGLKILKLHIIVGRLDVDAVQFSQLFIEDFCRLFAPMLGRSFVP